MIKIFEETSLAKCEEAANKWLKNEGCTYRVSQTQIFSKDKYSYALILTCEGWYKIAKYGGI